MDYADIKRFPHASYSVDVSLDYLQHTLAQWGDRDSTPLVMNPEWQRGHVWSESQQIAYMEYFMKGGRHGRDIFFNCSSWQGGYNTPIYCLDGLQRITAALRFLADEIPIFGHTISQITGKMRLHIGNFKFHVMCLENKREMLTVYLDMNSGGTPHNKEELDRVSQMIEKLDGSETV